MQTRRYRLSVLAQAINLIKEGIFNEQWQEHLPQERRLAEDLNVSRSTIRRALLEIEALGIIEPGRRGARRKITAKRSIKNKRVDPKNLKIIWLTPDASDQVPSIGKDLYIETQMRLAMNGCDLNMVTLPSRPKANPSAYMSDWAREYSADAYLLQSMSPKVQSWFSMYQRNACLLGNQAEGVNLCSVAVDMEASVDHALNMLRRMKHRRVCMFYRSIPLLVGEVQCRDVFLSKAFDDMDAEAVGFGQDPADLRKSMERLFLNSRRKSPSALVCTLPYLALYAMSWLLRHQISVPDEVSILLLRSQNLLRYVSPTFAHYSINEKRFVPLLVNRLLDIARSGASNGREIVLTPEFIPGESLIENT